MNKAAMHADPGRILRQLRASRGWTLGDVSDRVGLPVSTLSKIETGKMSLSYEKLMRISKGLDLDISVFFTGGEAEPAAQPIGRRSIVRRGEGRKIDTSTYEYTYPAADLLNQSLNPMIIDVRVRSIAAFGELMRHSGEEFAIVLEGAIDFYSDLYAPTRLETGDTIYFDGEMGHGYVAAAPGRCRVMCVCSASEQTLKAVLDRRATAPRTDSD